MADEIFSAVAPEPAQTEVAVQQRPSFSPRFSAEDRANILGSNDPDALKSFAKSLTQDELAALEDPARGLDSLFSASANAQQESDPAAAAAPVAAPAATPAPKATPRHRNDSWRIGPTETQSSSRESPRQSNNQAKSRQSQAAVSWNTFLPNRGDKPHRTKTI